MSAQALLSLIAPAAPAAAQGVSITGASAPEGLFASLLAGDWTAGEDEAAIEVEDGEVAEAPEFVVAPAMGPITPVLIAIPDLPPASAEAPVAPAGAGVDIPVPDLTSVVPPPANPSAMAEPAPPVATPAPDFMPAAVSASPASPEETPVEDAAPVPVVAKAVNPPQTATTSAPPAPVAAPTLRLLAERTSNPRNPEDVEGSAGSEPASSAPSPTVSSSASPAPAKPDGAGEVHAFVSADAEAPRADAGSAAGEARSGESAEAHTARDVSLNAMSRTAIDATAQIAAQIIRKLEGRSTRFEMALTPDDLGRVDVKLDIDSEGQLAARLAFDNPAAAADLRGRADELRRQLEAQGLQLADDAFEFTERDSGSHAFDRGQDQRERPSRAFSSAARLNAETDARPARWTPLSLSPSGVDLKV